MLLANPGVDPAQANNNGCTPLTIACDKNHPAVATVLLDHGANPHGASTSGKTALSCARKHPTSAFPPGLLLRLGLAPDPTGPEVQVVATLSFDERMVKKNRAARACGDFIDFSKQSGHTHNPLVL